MIETLEEIVKTLKEARKKKGLSQKTLGNKVGLPQSHISKIERGEVDLQTTSLIQLARTLELEVVLVSPMYVSVVHALERGGHSQQTSMYEVTEEDED